MRSSRHLPRQRSPFLALPPEIRNRIYKTALVSPFPIELSPANYMMTAEEFAQDAETRRRYEAYMLDDTKPKVWLPHPGQETEIIFRIQSDLLHVRKHLATGLLGTCTQVYDEAADYFWGSNTWRFSHDEDWVILYRFLLTIGPAARLRIHRLDVLAPNTSGTAQPLASYRNWQTKNHPQLHMTKLWRNDCRYYLPDCTKFVYAMLMQEKSLRELNLTIPCGYEFWAADRVDMIPQGFLPRVQIVVEAGGALYLWNRLAITGWDLLGLNDSDLVDSSDGGSFFANTTGREQLWRSEYDYLNGVSQLFEIEEISIHANGGRAHVPRKGQNTRRVLQAFGPCVILAEDIHCPCWKCCRPWRYTRHILGTRYKSLVDV